MLCPSDARGFPSPPLHTLGGGADCLLAPTLQDVCWSLKQDITGQGLQVSLGKSFISGMVLAPAAVRGGRDFGGTGAPQSVPSLPR